MKFWGGAAIAFIAESARLYLSSHLLALWPPSSFPLFLWSLPLLSPSERCGRGLEGLHEFVLSETVIQHGRNANMRVCGYVDPLTTGSHPSFNRKTSLWDNLYH